MTGTIGESTVNAVTTITIEHAERRNALSSAMLASLADLMQAPAGRAVVLAGADDVFSAGADLSELADAGGAAALENVLATAADAIAACPVPVIAAIEGACLGAAVELVAACDIRVVSAAAFFEIPATRLGILYRPAGVERLCRRLGTDVVRRLLLANQRMSAADVGVFAAPLIAPGAAHAEAQRLAAHVATLSPEAVQATKHMLASIESSQLEEGEWEAIRSELRDQTLG